VKKEGIGGAGVQGKNPEKTAMKKARKMVLQE